MKELAGISGRISASSENQARRSVEPPTPHLQRVAVTSQRDVAVNSGE